MKLILVNFVFIIINLSYFSSCTYNIEKTNIEKKDSLNLDGNDTDTDSKPKPNAITANPNASTRTIELLNYLKSLPERTDKRIISGQFMARPSAFETDVASIYNKTGHWPGMLGGDYYHQDWDGDAIYNNVNPILIDYWEKGGLVTINIHPFNPETGGSCQNNLKIDLEALLTPGTPSHIVWERQLKLLADGLEDLQKEGVVVLWRPFHEMCGGFWWGVNGGEPPAQFRALWKWMFDYFTYKRKLNNLLWVFTSGGCFEDYYPDIAEFVDITGGDAYSETPRNMWWQQNIQTEFTGKPFAFTEFGPFHWSTDGVREKAPFDFTILRDALKNDLKNSVWFLEWGGVWGLGSELHNNADVLLSDPIIINRKDISF